MSFWGAKQGTTASVEWASSLTDAGRTNWNILTNLLVTSRLMTNDIPMFFRVRGVANTDGWVYWPPSQAGSGHWYKAVLIAEGVSWSNANVAATNAGGYLACISSAQENAFVFSLVDSAAFWQFDGRWNYGPWIGGVQTNKESEPAGGWSWVSGEPWSYVNWANGQPDNSGNIEEHAHFLANTSGHASTWNDLPSSLGAAGWVHGYVIECEVSPAGP